MELQPFVPQEWCLACRRCCRFADPSDAQTPALAPLEVRRAVDAGAAPAWFAPLPDGPSQGVRLTAHPRGGLQCPALAPATHHCRIYAARPFDCQLYPFVVTRDASRQRLLVGVDTKCPYVQQLGPGRALRDYGAYLVRLLDSPDGQQLMRDNPALAGRPRGEFWTISPLDDPLPPPV
ncbi:MAG: YkgJ family cysteine cluster protein, partial [Candidatus Omnitrophica bacterium]|nr:YkgJ family cysteine cluster protein [Candidatus Omnitrophota bacterium]